LTGRNAAFLAGCAQLLTAMPSERKTAAGSSFGKIDIQLNKR
jgi:hypothetical protein